MENAYFYEQNHQFSAMESYFLDVSGIEGTDLYCDSESAATIKEEIDGMPLRAIHHIGNGNYHYVSLFFLERIREPFELILFDHHSDDQPGAFGEGLLSCGSWVLEARNKLPNLKYVNWIGKPGTDNSYTDSGNRLPVYVSIDLDVLGEEFIETVWDQGDMTPEKLERILGGIAGKRKILGVDICGYTDVDHPVIKNLDGLLSGTD